MKQYDEIVGRLRELIEWMYFILVLETSWKNSARLIQLR